MMGFSDWYCVDFITLWDSDKNGYGIMTTCGRCRYLPKKEVAPLDREEFNFFDRKAYKNGSISISEVYAKKQGWLNESD